MADEIKATSPHALQRTTPRRSPRRPVAVFASITLLIGLLIGAFGASVLRPWDDTYVNLTAMLQPPSADHPMGTDSLGRDLMAQVLHGLRVSFAISAAAAVIAVVIGTAVGLSAAVIGGRLDYILMRVVDVFQSQNHLLLSIFITVLFRPVFGPAGAIMLAVSLTHWVTVARIVRAQLLAVREEQYVAAAVNLGASRRRIIWDHYLPDLLPAIALAFVLLVPHAIFHESGLSFLGLGMPPHEPSLGSLLSESRQTLLTGGWWMAAFPGAAIFLAATAIGVVGEYWRARLHPQWGSELELG